MKSYSGLFIINILLILASMIGLGFASGKEVENFFCISNLTSFFPLAIFVIALIILYRKIIKFKVVSKVKNFTDFNKQLFPNRNFFVIVILIIIYSVSSASMLAGLDIIAYEMYNIRYPILSFGISLICFFILSGGKKRSDKFFTKFIPILLVIIFINLFVNAWNVSNKFTSFNYMFLTSKTSLLDIAKSLVLPVLYLGANFVLMIGKILNNNSHDKNSCVAVILVVSIFLFLGILVINGYKINHSMPFLTISKNISVVFNYCYCFAILIALISTLLISTYNVLDFSKNNSKYYLILIIIFNQILSLIGFNFIIKYLYYFSGIVGTIYCLFVYININKYLKQNKNN